MRTVALCLTLLALPLPAAAAGEPPTLKGPAPMGPAPMGLAPMGPTRMGPAPTGPGPTPPGPAPALTGPAAAFNAFYLGTWTVAAVVPHPWPWRNAAPAGMDAVRPLVGTQVTFGRARVDGPRGLACADARYSIGRATALTMFDGRLNHILLPPDADTRDADAQRIFYSPQKLAARLGFSGDSWNDLTIGCTPAKAEGPVQPISDRHIYFADQSRAAYDNGDVILMLRR